MRTVLTLKRMVDHKPRWLWKPPNGRRSVRLVRRILLRMLQLDVHILRLRRRTQLSTRLLLRQKTQCEQGETVPLRSSTRGNGDL